MRRNFSMSHFSTALPDSTSESDLQSDSVTKLTTDEETEVPPPPGTEPLLPIPAIGSSPERDRERREPSVIEREERREDYRGERHSREQRRSFSKDSHSDRYVFSIHLYFDINYITSSN